MQIARHLHADIDQRMLRKLFDHVIEKADPGRNIIGPGAIELDLDRDRRSGGFPLDPCAADGRAIIRSVACASIAAPNYRLPTSAIAARTQPPHAPTTLH